MELSAERPNLEVVYDYYNLMSGRVGAERTAGNTRKPSIWKAGLQSRMLKG